MRTLLLIVMSLAALPPAAAQDWQGKLKAAMVDPARPSADRARDANRLPLETLEFMGFDDDLRVLELFPGTGWYTRLLAPVLADDGKLYAAISTRRLREAVPGSPALASVEILDVNPEFVSTEQAGVHYLGPFSFWVEDIDLVLTFRNVHNLNVEGRANLNEAVFEALRPGGLYGVVDHTRRHMEPDTAANRRRADPVQVIHETLAAGFEFVGYSDLLHRPGDRLDLEVGDERVTGRTDRFTLLFRKPGS
jgi:predicted methyltransferase